MAVNIWSFLFFPPFFFKSLSRNKPALYTLPPERTSLHAAGDVEQGPCVEAGGRRSKNPPPVRQTEGCDRQPILRLLPRLVPSPRGKASTCLSGPPGESISGWFTQRCCKQHVGEVGFPSISLPSPEEKAAGPRENLSRKSNSALFFSQGM